MEIIFILILKNESVFVLRYLFDRRIPDITSKKN